jgi:hypothetical protein
MPTESEEVLTRDTIAAAEGQVRAALTLINDASRRVQNTRPDLSGDLALLGVGLVRMISKLDGERTAPVAIPTATPETTTCRR